ncbi:MAG: gliding motility-associated C-terminal domain-containing protein [Saprospiraceae bacterium]|nr:gliding motility-associated C-terminal domain-containing protein [Saprospiraceae bacterium]
MLNKFLCAAAWFLGTLSASGQVYTVNTSNDLDDGTCDGVHCSFREAIRAAEADGMASTILFAIPGAGPHVISPLSSFPAVLEPGLEIAGNSQPGGPGSIVIDFNFRDLLGIPFLAVRAGQVHITGLSFTDFRFENAPDCIFEFDSAPDCSVRESAFFADNNINPVAEKVFIRLRNADRFRLATSHFGTDLSKSSIVQTEGAVKVEATQGILSASIDSNIFAARVPLVHLYGGNVDLNGNIFGALDTNKSVNFLNPTVGILVLGGDRVAIRDNFFFGFLTAATDVQAVNGSLEISRNRFYNDAIDVRMDGFTSPAVVADNYGRDGGGFVLAGNLGELYVEDNSISNYSYLVSAATPQNYRTARYMGNRFTCMTGKPVVMPPRPVPVVTSVNRDAIVGTGLPNDSVVVYARNSLQCPSADCHGGAELGRTQADASGNWALQVAYPNRSRISAYQFDANTSAVPRIHSEFSECFVCSVQVVLVYEPNICSGQTVTIRGKVYDETNAYDSIIVRGDGVSICDSSIVVKLQVSQAYREQLDVLICYGDTVRMGPLEIHKNNPLDSFTVQSSAGCDSTVVVRGREVGVSFYSRTICDNAFVDIGGMRFDKNRTSGTATLPGAAEGGCDSVVFVQLFINNFSESFLTLVRCPGDSLVINGQVFNEARPSGDVLLANGSSTGCDSIIHVQLSFPNNRGAFSTSLCSGDSVYIIDRFFSDRLLAARITIPGGSSFGCDTITDVTINLMPDGQGFFTADLCRSDTLWLFGEAFFSGKPNGMLRLANTAANGCDSLIDVAINILPDAIGTFDTSLCENASVTYYGQTFSAARPRGSFRIPQGSYRMCDSFVNVTLQLLPLASSTFSSTICRGDSVRIGNQYFSAQNPSGTIVLTGASALGCDSSIQVSLSISPPILAQLQPKALHCNEPNTGEVFLETISGGTGIYQIALDNGPLQAAAPGLRLTGLSAGGHTARLVDQVGCDTVVSFNVNTSAILQLQLPGDTTIKLGGVVSINPQTNFNYVTLRWDPANFLSCDTCLTTQSRPDQTITYTLTLTDPEGCPVSDQFTITVLIDEADIFVPNVFSPNGDNINDLFRPVFKFPEKTSISVFRIYDRWGEMVFEQANAPVGESVTWDGTTSGKKLNPGVYTYIIQFAGEDGIPRWKAGDLTLVR